MIRWLALLVSLAATADADTARVTSGEHADFTRLVIELPQAADWVVGRTPMGYGFASAAPVQPDYDVSRVWDRIPRSRLQALRIDPESGALLLTLACDCHIFPFEYQPGTVVLDVRNGPPPPGSAFETALSLETQPQPWSRPPFARTATVYDWIGLPRTAADEETPRTLGLPLGPNSVSLDPLRDELLLQLSRGAADGMVDMVLPGRPNVPAVESMGDIAGALISIGALPGLDVGSPGPTLETRDEACFPDEVIDLSGWGQGRAPLDLLAQARSGLYEEFDTLSSEALLQTVRLHLYLGFGAEAAQYGALLDGVDRDTELAPLLAMASLIDGEADQTSPFVTMLGCDGTAALWAALAHASLPAAARIDTDAVVRSFQTLPPHLRGHLGPRLANLLLARDGDAARMIRDAVERTPEVPAGTIALIEAEAELQASRPEAALVHAERAVLEDGSGLDALAALVEAHFQSGLVLSPDVADSITALRDVPREDAARRDRALILALAMSGQVDAAFDLAGTDSPVGADLWKAVARHADDNAFLAYAVLGPEYMASPVDPEVGLQIGVRLANFGFPEAALNWLGPFNSGATPEWRVAAATAELALGNARGTLRLLSGLGSPEALALQASAYQQLGAYDAARQVLANAGKVAEGNRLASWGGAWEILKADGAPAWAEAAMVLEPAPAPSAGPLAEGQAALEDSAAARSAISALLAEVPALSP